MSKARSSTNPATQQDELDELAGELYAMRPDAFAAARDEQVRKARAEGRQPLARKLSGLRRPTQSAWLINLLWRDQPQVMQQFLQLADELSQAQAQASGPDLHRLTAQRREVEAALIRRARTLAENAGVNVSPTMEREAQETLSAALARPEVAAAVGSGRLVKPASYAGFGPGFATGSPAATDASGQLLKTTDTQSPRQPFESTDTRAQRPAPSRPPQKKDRDVRAAQRVRERREEAERRVAEARALADAAAAALDDQVRAAAAAEQHHQNLREQLEQLEVQVRDLKQQVAAAEQAAAATARRGEQAEKAHEAAVRTLDRAAQQVQESAEVN